MLQRIENKKKRGGSCTLTFFLHSSPFHAFFIVVICPLLCHVYLFIFCCLSVYLCKGIYECVCARERERGREEIERR